MFTGIIEEVGRIRAIERQAVSARLTVAASKVLSDVHLGDSIAVNGVCLTVTSFGRDYFCADVMHETLNRSSLGALGVKSPVNLERAMLAGGRFGGHIVSGHIDGTGTIRDVRRGKTGPIPRELQNVHADGTGFEREQGYLYPHNFPNHYVKQQYLPDSLKDVKYYKYGDNKTEQAFKAYWDKIKGGQ